MSVARINSGATVQNTLIHIDESTSFVSSIAAALYDIWFEAAVIALVLHIYMRLTSSSPGLLRRIAGLRPAPKAAQSKLAHDEVEKPRRPAHVDRLDIKTFVINVVNKSETLGNVLQQYEEYVRSQHVDMRHHISDAQTARSFYFSLIESGLQAVVENPRSAGLSARTTTSRLLADMRLFSFARNHDFYSALLKLHAVGRLFDDAMWLYDVMTADGVVPDRIMCGYLLSVAVSCGQDQKAISFFKEISKMGVAPMRTYMTILRVYSKSSDWRGAVELLESLKAAGGSPDALVLNTVLGLCVGRGEVRVAEGLLMHWADNADAVSCNIVLKGYTQQVSLMKAEKLLKRMLDSGPTPNIITFNTIMDCAVRNLQRSTQAHGADGRHDVASTTQRQWQLLDMLIELGLEPDRYTCSTLVKGLHLTGCSVQDIDRAVALVRQIGSAGLHATASATSSSAPSEATNARLQEVLFNTLLDACASSRDLDRMAEIFALMRSFEVEVSSVTFGTLIKAFGQAGQLCHCHEVWKNMLDARVKPTVVTFGCYIDTCIRNGDHAVAEQVFMSMPKIGVRPNAVIYTSMIRGYAQAKKPHKALEMYQRMRTEGIEATAVTFNSVLDILVRQLADPAQLQEIVDDMHRSSVKPDVVTYSILIKASCNAGQVDNALALFRRLRGEGLAFDEVAFNTLLLACSKAEQLVEAEEILGEMRAIGMAPTHVTISILVKMYGKAKMLDKAIELSQFVEKEYGMKPNLHVYTCLIQACVRNKQIRRSWEVFGGMLCSQTPPDAITYGTVIQGCVYHSKFDQAMALVRHSYALEGPCILESLGVSSTGSGGRDLRRKQAIPLQTDVLKALLAALKRKDQGAQANELQSIMDVHGRARPSEPRHFRASQPQLRQGGTTNGQ